jgi:hypothetical protein
MLKRADFVVDTKKARCGRAFVLMPSIGGVGSAA